MTPEIQEKKRLLEELKNKARENVKQHQKARASLETLNLPIKKGTNQQLPQLEEQITEEEFLHSTPKGTSPIALYSIISVDGPVYQVTDAYMHELDEDGNDEISPEFYSDIWWTTKEAAKAHWKNGLRLNGYLVQLSKPESGDGWKSGKEVGTIDVLKYKTDELHSIIRTLDKEYESILEARRMLELEIERLEEASVIEAIDEKIASLSTKPKLWGIEHLLPSDTTRLFRVNGGCPETALSPCHTEYRTDRDWCRTFKKYYKELPSIHIVTRMGFKQFLCKNDTCEFKQKCPLAKLNRLRWETETNFASYTSYLDNGYRNCQHVIGGEPNLLRSYKVITAMEAAENALSK